MRGDAITLDHRSYPILFNNLALGKWCRQEKIPFHQLKESLVDMDMLAAADLIYFALLQGWRKEKNNGTPFPLEQEEARELILEDMTDNEDSPFNRAMKIMLRHMNARIEKEKETVEEVGNEKKPPATEAD